MKNILLVISIIFHTVVQAEVDVWDCNELKGAKIVSSDGEYLGTLGPSWGSDSIYNEYSEYSSEWGSNSIYNEYSDYGSDYSNASVFNEYASDPPKIINEDNEEIGLLSVGPDWDDERKHPEDIKYTCDWD